MPNKHMPRTRCRVGVGHNGECRLGKKIAFKLSEL